MATRILTIAAALWCGLATGAVVKAQDVPEPDSLQPAPEAPPAPPTHVDSETPSPQPVFTHIELNNEGVTAVDSVGNRWYYNFNTETFVEARDAEGAGIPTRDRTRTVEVAAPVEERCTERLQVDRLSRKAVYVGYDEYVDGDIVAASRVTIKGWVKGNVQSLNKTVLVTASGQVDGDIRAPEIEVKPGGVVLGRQIQTEPYSALPDYLTTQFSALGIWIVFAFTLALLLMVFLSVALAPRQMGRMVDCLTRYRFRCFLLGFVLVFLLPVILTLVTITVVGIVILPFVPFGLLAVLAFGMTATVRPLVNMVRPNAAPQGLLIPAMLSVLAYMVLWAAVAILLGASGPNANVYEGFGYALLVVAIVFTAYPFMSGLGAAALTRFGYRDYTSFRERTGPDERAAAAPAPPPMPQSPHWPRPFVPPPQHPGYPPDKMRPPSEGR